MRKNRLLLYSLPLILVLGLGFIHSVAARAAPWIMRISCGALLNVHTQPTNTLWHKDFAYTGGVPVNATRPSYITPHLNTLRYFPTSAGSNNCYIIRRVPPGHYNVRVFFGLVAQEDFNNEPQFDISIEGTQIYSLESGWSVHDDQSFVEAQAFLLNGTASICFHSTGHGDPAIISLEILQIDDAAYASPSTGNRRTILRNAVRLSCGSGKPQFDVDYHGDHWGGDRFWSAAKTFGQGSDIAISTETEIKVLSDAPNFYPQSLYQTALVGTASQDDLSFTMEVEPNRNYSIWLHFAEIEVSITAAGQRVFNVLINGDVVFKDVDIVKLTGARFTALVLNTSVPVDGRTLTISFQKGTAFPLISAIEVFEIVQTEAKTAEDEVKVMQSLKDALNLPPRFGWNGDPCVPQQHPWSGADCQFDKASNKWFIDGLDLSNQGLGGVLPNELSRLSHLLNLNFSSNSIRGNIPFSIGNVTGLKFLDISYNFFNGSIPESLGQLTSLQRLNLNGNSLSGRVPTDLVRNLLRGARFNFTDNSGLCGIPGLPSCGPHLSIAAKIGIAFIALVMLLLTASFLFIWRKRRQNILRAQQVAGRSAPYAQKRTHIAHDIQLSRHHNNGRARTATENGPSLLS